MKGKETPTREEARKELAVDWAEAEWFQVWLRLARRGYQGNSGNDGEALRLSSVIFA